MGTPTPVILTIETPGYGRVIVDASNGKRYHADLSSFSSVHCFPRTHAEWSDVSSDSYGLGLVWSSRFEVHIDQVIGLAERIEPHRQSA